MSDRVILNQTQQPVDYVFTLPRCDMALHADAGNGTIGELLWAMENVDSARFAGNYETVERRLTGVPHPVRHQTAERHEISIDAVWNIAGALRRGQEHILAVTWLDATEQKHDREWQRRYYVGVTMGSEDVNSRDGIEFTSAHTLTANYYVATTGTGTPEAITPGEAVC